VTYACNERCAFCYYLPEIESGKARTFTYDGLVRRIELAVRWGKTAVDLTGGEPTIRPDLPALVRACRERGLSEVTLITNGLRTASRAYAVELHGAGLTDALFSLHGATAATHDGLTRRPGSFERLLASMAVFRELGLGVRVNSVLTGRNLGELDALLALLAPLSPRAVNLLAFNPAEEAAGVGVESDVRLPSYEETGRVVSAALDRWKGRFRRVNVRFLPFCVLPGHADCVRTQWQKLHEDVEWDPVLNVWLQKGPLAALGATLAGALLPARGPRYVAADVQTWLARSLSAFRMRALYRHGPPCGRCSARRVCPGLPRDHVARLGFPALTPLPGPAVEDPLHFTDGPGGETIAGETGRALEAAG
jgi:MoaA/NifB/PqqE/SkfB family radical SAM enzyme